MAGVEVIDNTGAHRFEAALDGHLATSTYRLTQGTLTILHTTVPPELEGKGVGSAIVRFVLASARERGLKIIPLCRFFAAWFARHPEEADIISPRYRAPAAS